MLLGCQPVQKVHCHSSVNCVDKIQPSPWPLTGQYLCSVMLLWFMLEQNKLFLCKNERINAHVFAQNLQHVSHTASCRLCNASVGMLGNSFCVGACSSILTARGWCSGNSWHWRCAAVFEVSAHARSHVYLFNYTNANALTCTGKHKRDQHTALYYHIL